MDPNVALLELMRAAMEGDASTLEDRAEALADWLRRGGFRPSGFALLLETDNAAMCCRADVAGALGRLSRRLVGEAPEELTPDAGTILDGNGNTVGAWRLVP